MTLIIMVTTGLVLMPAMAMLIVTILMMVRVRLFCYDDDAMFMLRAMVRPIVTMLGMMRVKMI